MLATTAGVTLSQAADSAAPEAAGSPAKSPAITLSVGDPAPKLRVGEWVQGEPVKEFSRDHAYVVEFWATWCGPCKVSIPHLNELHQQFKDKGLVAIGVDCWERDDALVAPFVKTMGEKMSYRVVLDDKSGGSKGLMADTWMAAAGRTGIPAAFLVDKQGRIAWIGHPMKLEASLLEDVLAGRQDLQKAAKTFADERQKEQASQAANRQLTSLQLALSRQIAAAQWDEAEATLAKTEQLTQDLAPAVRARYRVARLRLLLSRKDLEGAVKFAQSLREADPGDFLIDYTIASQLVNVPEVKGPALELAAQLAQNGYANGGARSKLFILTLARVKMIQGDQAKAVELVTKALNDLPAAVTEAGRKRYQDLLDAYQAGHLPAIPAPR